MKIIYVDDERSAHVNFAFHIKERTDISMIAYFKDCKEPLEYVEMHDVDCAFLDIDLPGGNGIEIAKELKRIQPEMEVVFITSHDEFAREAYKVGGRGYLSKPYSNEELDEIITRVGKLVKRPPSAKEKQYDLEVPHIFAKTFGNFDLLLDGKSVHFKNAKVKELLAFLVDQMGGTASNAQIFFALWEKQEYTKSTSTYVRRTVRSLKEELDGYGIGHILISKRNSICIDVDAIACDYYDLLQGSRFALRHYNGKYMSQYSWGEETIPVIERMAMALETQSEPNEKLKYGISKM
ncbi:response regulator [Chakrabartyella piscis]|uniref:response regulator n=1 Tax=Chakrabartyella piscis TaxID=2918914 RepID=UPI0029589EBE|nr:response regulator [Chakrabartyella piscis]